MRAEHIGEDVVRETGLLEPERVAAACTELGQPAPDGEGETVRAILLSLACKYRLVLEHLEQVTGRGVDRIHVIGGGARNRLLCQLTADLSGHRVLAGPVEATALGNVMVQARAAGVIEGDLEALRAAVRSGLTLQDYQPSPDRQRALSS